MHTLSRREFLRVSSLTAAASLLTACVVPADETPPPAAPASEPEGPAAPAEPTEPTGDAPAAVETGRYSEAPMLAELVEQGLLPPIEERLPENPAIEPVVQAIGKYGGSWRRGFKGVSDRVGPNMLGARRLALWTPEQALRPELAEAWSYNDDASEWTVTLRKGGKWSDGSPFNSGCFRWWYDYHLTNTDITPAVSTAYKTGSGDEAVVMEVETPDDWTVVLKFAHPNPLFIYTLAGNEMWMPEYMEQFHIDTTPDPEALQNAATEAGFDSWSAYYLDRNSWYMNPDKPVVNVWKAANALSEQLFIMERNAYYMGVDETGQQLPYIDHVTHRLFDTPDVFNMWIISGEIDKQLRHVDLANYTLFKENEAEGDYTVLMAKSRGAVGLNTNLAAKDPKQREFLGTREVRLALSHAVNRDEINELVYDGLLTPCNCGPVESSPQYWDELFHAYTEYDPELANELLDQAGYDQRDGNGYRMWKDGSGPVEFIIESIWEPGSQTEDAAQMVTKYLQDVGLNAVYKYVERSLFEEHYLANELNVGFWGMDRNEMVIIQPEEFLGLMPDRPWAGAWGLWKANPNDPNGEEPPEGHWIWDIWDIWDQVKLEPDEDTRTELFHGILEIWLREVPQVCYLGQNPVIAICKNGFVNYEIRGENYTRTNSATYFWEEPEKHV